MSKSQLASAAYQNHRSLLLHRSQQSTWFSSPSRLASFRRTTLRDLRLAFGLRSTSDFLNGSL